MATDFSMNMDEYLPLRDVVFNTLRQAILYGKLQPGERLMEITLANQLGVSRTPVREAIRKLEIEGLVLMIPRKGAQVAPITEKDLNDVLEVRLGLEELAMNYACERVDSEQLAAILLAKDNFEASLKAGELGHLAKSDEEFHELIYQATGNRRLMQMINNLREQMYRYRIEYLKDANVGQSLKAEHAELYEALQDRDEKRAIRCMKKHIQNQQQAIVKSLREK
jgi:Transcriptional regulators